MQHPKLLFPEPKRMVGRWLGPSKSIVCDLVYKILTKSGNVIHTSAVEPVTQAERDMDAYKRLISDYDQAIKETLGPVLVEEGVREMFGLEEGETYPEIIINGAESQICTVRVHGAIEQETACIDGVQSTPAMNGTVVDDTGVPVDGTLNDAVSGWELARVKIPRGDGFRRGNVQRKKRDHNGDIIGTHSTNPILDTTVYEVAFDDGMLEDVLANVFAQAIYEDSDENGYNEGLILDTILDHFVSRKLTKFRSTSGCFFLVRWRDGSESVVRLKELMESYPVKVAQYAKDNSIDKEEGFWWTAYTLKKAARIIAKIKTRNVRLEKFGIRVPRSVEEALKFDRQSNTTYWKDAIDKEMRNIEIAFKVLDEGEHVPPGYQLIRCHFIFDVKIDGTRKARYVAGGHMTEAPSSITYSSVVSRDSIRILLVIAALNG